VQSTADEEKGLIFIVQTLTCTCRGMHHPTQCHNI